MMRFTRSSARKKEQGVTVLIVGFTLLALIAMAALAIDVANLYETRSEAQRAADAAALAGAKMFVTSGYTSNPANWTSTTICQTGGPGAVSAVNVQAALAAQANTIAGQPAAIKTITCDYNDLNNNTNPRVTVTVEVTNTAAFFSRIWGTQGGSVTATATAEAYNASGQNIPIELTNVKPWGVANCGPNPTSPCPSSAGFYINPADGTVLNNNFIGEEVYFLRQTGTGSLQGTFSGGSNIPTGGMYGLNFPASPAPACPASTSPSCAFALGFGDNYINGIACASKLAMHCGDPIGPGQQITVATSSAGGSPSRTGTRCLIHADDQGDDQGQDLIPRHGTPLGTPIDITGGYHNPNPSLQGVANISRSDSIVTVPLITGCRLVPGGGSVPMCTGSVDRVLGFLQLALIEAPEDTPGPQVHAVIMNAVGCSPGLPNPPSNPIAAGSVSPIIVRLVQTPTP